MSEDPSGCLPGMVAVARQQTAVVDSVRQMAVGTWAMRLNAPDLARTVTPGQFFMIRPASGSDPLLGRPFALYDTYEDTAGNPAGVEFGFVEVGKLTSQMNHWTPGTEAQIWGPLGNGFPVPD